jgi:hypothetical protein
VVKGLKTRQKLVFRTDGLRPRNPVAVVARKRAAGVHEKSPGALRQQAEHRLRRLLGSSEILGKGDRVPHAPQPAGRKRKV